MERPIHPEHKEKILPLEDQIRECFGRVVYSHKAHEKTADILTRRIARIRLAQIILSAVITAGLITSLVGSPDKSRVAALVATVLSAALLALNTYTKDLDLGQSSERHKETAARLWTVRESYMSVLSDIHSGTTSLQEVQSRRDELQAKLEGIYATAPRTLDAAYKRAGIALKEREELTFSAAEIDCFLPPSLRRGIGLSVGSVGRDLSIDGCFRRKMPPYLAVIIDYLTLGRRFPRMRGVLEMW
jgi:type II secretory pathway pseudopilin PulG